MSGSGRQRTAAIALQELIRLLPHRGLCEGDTAESFNHAPIQDLWLWLRAIMTIYTKSSLLGKGNNPWIKDASLVESYWTFDAGDPTGRTSLIDVTYQNSKKWHDKMVDALEVYFAAGYDLSSDKSSDSYVAPLTVDTAVIQREHVFGAREIAVTYVAIVHGGLVNMVPTLFWCLAYVYSRPSLPVRLREELILAVVTGKEKESREDGEHRTALIDSDRIESRCALLLAVIRETQRLVAIGTLHRRVLEDTIVSPDRNEDQSKYYLLKKGTSVLLPVASANATRSFGDLRPMTLI